MTVGGIITGVSVNHVDASVDEIEAASAESVRTRVRELCSREGVDEAFALQTCNRAEAYVVTERVADGQAALADFAPTVRDRGVVVMDHEESLRHLMRVAAGLESLVLGEDQIIGQVKTASEESRAVGGLGPVLDDAILKAVHVGERARTETAINEGVVSLGSAAVELASDAVELADATALVVGAGEMGTLAAMAFARTPIDRLLVANRTVPHATHLAETVEVDARAVGLNAIPAAVSAASVVVTATGSASYVLDAATLRDAGETLVIDIAQPRDVDPVADDLSGVTVRDIDDLEAVTTSTRRARRTAARRVETMIDEAFDHLMETYKRKRADDAVAAMYESAARVKAQEVQTALSKLDAQGPLTDAQRETVESLADALVGQLLAAPTRSLREAAAEDDWTTIQTAMRLFDPDFDGSPPTVAGTDGPRDATDAPPTVLEELADD